MDDYIVTKMTRQELDLAVEWAAVEGWNPGIGDADCYYATDSNGFFIGRFKDEIISVGSAVCYDDDFAFCGFYIVKPEYRGKGFGMALTQERLAYVGDRCIGIDGVLENVAIYQRLGYEPFYKNIRYHANSIVEAKSDEAIVPIAQVPRQLIHAYDRQCFPAERLGLIDCWIAKKERHALAYFQNGELKGFGVIRPAQDAYRIGPLFADNEIIAESLLWHLVKKAGCQQFYIDVPENNVAAMKVAKHYSWQQCFATMRMYRNGTPSATAKEKVFAITNFELG